MTGIADRIPAAAPRETPVISRQYPLSPLQRRLWFVACAEPLSRALVIPLAIGIAGPLDLTALEQALDALLVRHDALRTRIVGPLAAPMQEAAPPKSLPLSRIDLADATDPTDTLRRLIESETRSFNMRGSLVRAVLVRRGAEDHLLLITLHHLLTDGWSIDVLLRDLRLLYRREVDPTRPALPDIRLGYRDYVIAQHHAEARGWTAELAYWTEHLKAAPPGPILPRMTVQSVGVAGGQSVSCVLPADRTAALRDLARRTCVTLPAALLTAYQVLLHRWTGQIDLLIGVPFGHRDLPELDDVVGFFVNIMPLRCNLSGDPCFSRLLPETAAALFDALDNKDVPFDRIVQAVREGAGAGAGGELSLQASFDYQPLPAPTDQIGPVAMRLEEIETGIARYPLSLKVFDRGADILVTFDYDRAFLDPEAAAAMSRQYLRLLNAMMEAPETSIGSTNLIDEDDRRWLVEGVNGSATPLPPECSTAELLGRAVTAQPDAVAVVERASHLTYAALLRTAGRLAAELRTLNARPERLVAVLARGTGDMATGLAAVRLAGAAYLPLDPAVPDERLRSILAASGAVAILASRSEAARLDGEGLPVMTIAPRSPAPEELPVATSHPEALAYVIYTSGSTGIPKGVAVPQGAVHNLVLGSDYALLRPGKRMLHLSNPAFDAATFEVWGALLNGATLVDAPAGEASTGALARLIVAERIDTMFITTALFNAVAQDRPEAFRNVVDLLVGGEAGDPNAFSRVLCSGPPKRLVNIYGPTETTTFATWHPLTAERVAFPVPIGSPVSRAVAYVLDTALGLVPPGVLGELFLGGAGVARGYHHQPAATAERFLPDPFGQPGARIYRTGDQVRRMLDGKIVYVGRLDRQVKLRGFRIEPAEVEAALTALPQIREAKVAPRRMADDIGLVAYLVLQPEAEGPLDELRVALRARLPGWLIPSALIPLRALPMTSNGKVDIGALDALAVPVTPPPVSADPPRGAMEEVVAVAAAHLLGRPVTDRAANLFDLGAHSLLLGRLATRLQDLTGLPVPLRALLEQPTVATIAAGLASRSPAGALRPAIEPAPPSARVPLALEQRRLWFLHCLDPESTAYNSGLAFTLPPALSDATLLDAVRRTLARHAVFRTRVVEDAGIPYQIVDADAPLPIRVVDIRPGGLAEAARLADAEAGRPLDLQAGPIARVLLIRLDAAVYLVLTVHHIAIDGESTAILARDLAVALDAAAPAAPPPLQYRDYALWQSHNIDAGTLDRQLDYWCQRLGPQPPVLRLPLDRRRPQRPGFAGNTLQFDLDGRTAKALLRLAKDEHTTLFPLLLGAFGAMLVQASGQRRGLIGTDIESRRQSSLHDIVGFFVNTLPFLIDLDAAASPRDLVRRLVRDRLAALGNAEVPFERIVGAVPVPRSDAGVPLIPALVSLRHEHEALPGPVTLASVHRKATARWDITLILRIRGDQLSGQWVYMTELFDLATIERLHRAFLAMLDAFATAPDGPIPTQAPFHTTQESLIMTTRTMPASPPGVPKFQAVRLDPVAVQGADAVTVAPLIDGDDAGPRRVTARHPALELAAWAQDSKQTLEDMLRRQGAILFRGFAVDGPEDFQRFGEAVGGELFEDYGDLPRGSVGDRIYNATPYPAEKAIGFHNEGVHTGKWPRRIMFYCRVPAATGGRTPVVDCRRLVETMDPDVREVLARKGIRYVRNFTFEQDYRDGLDVSWREFFRTSDKAEVEAACIANGNDFTWFDDGRLRISRTSPAIVRHPVTGDTCFISQLETHHLACLDSDLRSAVESIFTEDELPRHAYFGDGTPIDEATVAALTGSAWAQSVEFDWQPGDVMMVDNMLMAHARRPYTGARHIMVSMSEMVTSDMLLAAHAGN